MFTVGNARIPTSWSFSKWDLWRKCNRRYAYRYILKVPEKPHPAMDRGTEIHLMAESYVKGKMRGLPKTLEKFKEELGTLKRIQARTEEWWVITEDGTPTQFDNWKYAWLRAKVDAHKLIDDILLIIDYKSGRVNPSDAQSELYAWLGGEVFYPSAERIETELWFTDHGETHKLQFDRKDIKDLGKKWRDRGKRLLEDVIFSPSPGPQCERCSFRSSTTMANGKPGPCEEWRKV